MYWFCFVFFLIQEGQLSFLAEVTLPEENHSHPEKTVIQHNSGSVRHHSNGLSFRNTVNCYTIQAVSMSQISDVSIPNVMVYLSFQLLPLPSPLFFMCVIPYQSSPVLCSLQCQFDLLGSKHF